MSTALGNRLKELRIKHNFPQAVLASQAGVSHAYIGLVEKGTRTPSDDVLKKLADALHVKVEELYEARNNKIALIHIEPQSINSTCCENPDDDDLGRLLNLISDVEIRKKITSELIESVQEKLSNLLTPYTVTQLKPLFMDAKRIWSNLAMNCSQPIQPQDLIGSIQSNDSKIFFQLSLKNTVLELTLLHNERKNVTIFEPWLDTVNVSYPVDVRIPFFIESRRAVSFVWFSPALSALDRFSHLKKGNIFLNKVETNDPQLRWLLLNSSQGGDAPIANCN